MFKNYEIVEKLDEFIPRPVCELRYSSNFELLVAVILSAQCTDKRVNEVTFKLFKVANTPEAMDKMSLRELESLIFSCGFYHNKAKNIKAMSLSLLDNFNGVVPCTIADLESLAGVGKKTANVMMSEAFKGDAFAVDTHVFRVSGRLGIVKAKNAKECERQLLEFFEKKDWSKLHYQMVLLGRYTCKAQSPQCILCPLKDRCKFFNSKEECL